MTVFDCEGNSLNPTKFHVLSYWDGEKVISLTSYKEMKKWLLNQKVLIGHNIINWDVPNLERVLGIKIEAELIDTLYLSWYLYPLRIFHGLEYWGEDFNIIKPPIDDWENLPLEIYVHRCEEDVKINQKLWDKQSSLLHRIYDSVEDSYNLIRYLSFKADCAREAEQSKWKLDKEFCEKNLEFFLNEETIKVETLKNVMPPVPKLAPRNPPEKPFKKDGSLSVTGAKWKVLLNQRGLTDDHKETIYVVIGEEEPNPNSVPQIKNWLFSLGWEPTTFKEVKEDDGSLRYVPQIKKIDDPELCDSVKKLIEIEPAIEHLENLSIIKHRIGLLKGFLRDVDEEGYLRARVHGLTNTLRFKHTEIVNLPGEGKLYWEMVRGCLICDEGNYLVGSDMSALEDLTKRHFIYQYDPEYVEEMSIPGFDPHLDLAFRAGAISKEEISFYKEGSKNLGSNSLVEFKRIKVLRHTYKTTNYSATYGVGYEKLSRDLKIKKAVAKALLKAYWERNWAIKKVADECIVKTVDGQKWLFNPVSKFWYSLRSEKDRFSTLNQGTGVFCFDTWIREFRSRRPQLTGQFHDEIIIEIKERELIKAEKMLQAAIARTNNKLKLNVTLAIDIHHGKRYSDIH